MNRIGGNSIGTCFIDITRALGGWMLLSGVFLVFCLAGGETASASDDRALRRGTHPVWVDRENDSVRVPPHQLDRKDYSDRHTSIDGTANSGSGSAWWDYLWGSGSGSSFLSNLFTAVLQAWRILLLALLVICIGSAIYYFVRSGTFSFFMRRQSQQSFGEDVELQQTKISDLPFELEVPIMGLRAQAEKYRNAGDYSKAIVYLFSYLLVELDQSHCIRLERGKTNGAYLSEVVPWKQLWSYMQPVVRLFELAYFGRRTIDREPFEELWSKITTFEETLARVRANPRMADVPSPLPESLLSRESQ